ncbi:LiaF transmembrane domain-containing protein [Aureibacillus halotolerans]|uniref:LiaF transmembrane domain-containing protein n=1 Tax=Aureibacillus halotolerans TaxID=1508390 RepID=A0A4V3D5L0_9BACI|nr:hypothetical protein [Aureibacillus halotolerans]TDQ40477.1 hypothetical protein EV213_106196 [Aureibacillus halotolerans]
MHDPHHRKKHPIFGTLLAGLGVIIFLAVLGLNLGNIIRLGVAVLFFYLAWKCHTSRKESKTATIIFAVIGGILLISSLDILIGLAISALFIWLGTKLLKGKKEPEIEIVTPGYFETNAQAHSFDKEFERKMNTKKYN